jgi:hypothetical protein
LKLTDLDPNIQKFQYITEYIGYFGNLPTNDEMIFFWFNEVNHVEFYDVDQDKINIREYITEYFSDGDVLCSYNVKTGEYKKYSLEVEETKWYPDDSNDGTYEYLNEDINPY